MRLGNFLAGVLNAVNPLQGGLGGVIGPEMLMDRDDIGGSALDVNFDGGDIIFGFYPAFGSTFENVPVNVTIVNIPGPGLEATKDDFHLVDNDGDGKVEPGDTLQYTVTITNVGEEDASDVAFQDEPDGNTELVVGSVVASQGNVIVGNSAGDRIVEVEFGTIPSGASASVIFDVVIDAPLPSDVLEVANQGTVLLGAFAIPTDDPATTPSRDPTATEVANTPLEQCLDSLLECTVDLAECRAAPPAADADDDGEADATDQCADTPANTEVDGNGCSQEQFCDGIFGVRSKGRKVQYRDFLACLRSDWQNDEPLSNRPDDCRFDRASMGCVAK